MSLGGNFRFTSSPSAAEVDATCSGRMLRFACDLHHLGYTTFVCCVIPLLSGINPLTLHSVLVPILPKGRAFPTSSCMLIMLEDMSYHGTWLILEGRWNSGVGESAPRDEAACCPDFVPFCGKWGSSNMLGSGEEKSASAPGFAQSGASIPRRQSASPRPGCVRMYLDAFFAREH